MEFIFSNTVGNLADYIGMAGSILLIMAFSKCVLSPSFAEGPKFLILNLLGSILLLPSAYAHNSTAAFAICSFWIIASLAALFNKNQLSTKLLYPLATIFSVYTAFQIYTVSGLEYFFLKLLSLIAVETFVISYSLFIAKKTTPFNYFLATFIGNAIFIPCLFVEGNISSLVLQSFCLVSSAYGLVNEKRVKRFNMNNTSSTQ